MIFLVHVISQLMGSPFSFFLLLHWGVNECEKAWKAHLLRAREGVIEAGYIGHYGLLVRPQRTHDVYASPSRTERGWRRKVNRERKREWSQSYPKLHCPRSMQGARAKVGKRDASSLGASSGCSHYHHQSPPSPRAGGRTQSSVE